MKMSRVEIPRGGTYKYYWRQLQFMYPLQSSDKSPPTRTRRAELFCQPKGAFTRYASTKNYTYQKTCHTFPLPTDESKSSLAKTRRKRGSQGQVRRYLFGHHYHEVIASTRPDWTTLHYLSIFCTTYTYVCIVILRQTRG